MLGYFIMGLVPVLTTGVYLSFFIYRLCKVIFHLKMIKYYLIFIVIGSLIVALPAMNFFGIYAIIFYHIIVISLVLEIPYFFLKNVSFVQHIIPTGILAICITALIMAYGYYNINHIVETDYTIQTDQFNDYKILQITDLHMSNSLSVSQLQTKCEEMSKTKPDIVVLTGDIFDEQTPLEDMKDACRILSQLSNKEGIYYVYGNHDNAQYSSNPQFDEDVIREEFEKHGVTVLNDEVVNLKQLSIIGRRDAHYSQDNIRKDTTELVKQCQKGNYILVLDHQPLQLEENEKAGVDLQLSGHTYGGQIFPMQQIQPLVTHQLVYGKKQINNFTAITSSGIAGWGYPIKTGAKSEYVVVTLK